MTLLERFAELVVRVGVNVQPGQDVHVGCLVEHAPIARAVAEAAYRAGARRVAVTYDDPSRWDRRPGDRERRLGAAGRDASRQRRVI